MASGWRLLCTIVCAIEGTIGLVLSLFLFCIIVAKRSNTTDPSYRFCIALNASQGAFNCILLISGLWTHVLSDGFFLAIVYGPVQLAPRWLMDIVVSIAVVMCFSLWQFITAPCIVQYLVLFKKSIPNAARVSIAYLFTALSMAISAPYFWLFVPYPGIQGRLREIAMKVQQLQDDEPFIVYGIGMHEDPANGNRTALGLAFYGIAPSYSLTYAVFGFTVLKIVRALGRVNTELSIKTVTLQRGFGFIPLAILTVPFVTFITFIFTGTNIDNWTLMLTFSLWSLPAVQAIVYLKYLFRTARTVTLYIRLCLVDMLFSLATGWNCFVNMLNRWLGRTANPSEISLADLPPDIIRIIIAMIDEPLGAGVGLISPTWNVLALENLDKIYHPIDNIRIWMKNGNELTMEVILYKRDCRCFGLDQWERGTMNDNMIKVISPSCPNEDLSAQRNRVRSVLSKMAKWCSRIGEIGIDNLDLATFNMIIECLKSAPAEKMTMNAPIFNGVALSLTEVRSALIGKMSISEFQFNGVTLNL